MFNFRIGGIAAALAFIVSFLLGLLSRSAMPVLVLKPFVFAALFFILSWFISMIVSRFLPELLDGAGNGPAADIAMPGTRVNISEDGLFPVYSGVPAVPAQNAALADDDDENLDDIGSFSNKAPSAGRVPGLDQNMEDGYTKEGGLETLPSAEGADLAPMSVDSRSVAADESFSPAETGGAIDILPDLDSLANAFLPSSGDEGGDVVDYSSPVPARKPLSRGKGQKMEGDFNPKDLAAGIRTVLNKEG